MNRSIPLNSMENVALMIANPGSGVYPSSKIQKGLVLALNGKDVSEEGVGFGLPVLKFGEKAVFPGSCRTELEAEMDHTTIRVDYDMNLVGRMTWVGGRIENRAFYMLRNAQALLHRNCPWLRIGLEMAYEPLRCAFGLNVFFERVPSAGKVRAAYTVDGHALHVDLNILKKDACTEIAIMNELGANYFDYYHDSDGLILQDKAIGSWQECFAEEASFIDRKDGIAFTLKKMNGSRMFLGRELASRGLAWAGLAYMLPAGTKRFSYTIRLGVP